MHKVCKFHQMIAFFMSKPNFHRFSGHVSVFQEKRLPETARLAGYAALIDAFKLEVPLPLTLCAIGPRHKIYEQEGWRIYSPRHEPAATLEGNLTFALKYEGLDLIVLKRLFQSISAGVFNGHRQGETQ